MEESLRGSFGLQPQLASQCSRPVPACRLLSQLIVSQSSIPTNISLRSLYYRNIIFIIFINVNMYVEGIYLKNYCFYRHKRGAVPMQDPAEPHIKSIISLYFFNSSERQVVCRLRAGVRSSRVSSIVRTGLEAPRQLLIQVQKWSYERDLISYWYFCNVDMIRV